MKFFAIAIVFFVAATVTSADEPGSFRKELVEAHKKCNLEPKTAVDLELLKEYVRNKGTAPENLDAHSICAAKELHLLHHDDTLNTEHLRILISDRESDLAKVETIRHKCVVTKDTVEATAKHLLQCLSEEFNHLNTL